MISATTCHPTVPPAAPPMPLVPEDGWLGQVPPPAPPAPPAAPTPSPYAVPELAPEPWKSDPPLYGTDPTLFG